MALGNDDAPYLGEDDGGDIGDYYDEDEYDNVDIDLGPPDLWEGGEGDDEDDLEGDLDGDQYGEDEMGRVRLLRRPRRRRRRSRFRRRPPVRRTRRPPAAAPRPQHRVKVKVRSNIVVLAATAAAAGAVTANKTVTKDMWIMNVTFDGSSTGAAVTQLQVDDRVVLGPFSSAEAVDASTFKSNAYQKLDLRGAFVPRGTTLTVNGTIGNASDYLKVLFHVKERIRSC